MLISFKSKYNHVFYDPLKPLLKKPKLDPCELTNYRPISNLPFMSKIFEKVVSAQLCSFLQKNISMKIFSQVLGPTIAQKLYLLKLQMTFFLRQTKAASHCKFYLILVLRSTL